MLIFSVLPGKVLFQMIRSLVFGLVLCAGSSLLAVERNPIENLPRSQMKDGAMYEIQTHGLRLSRYSG